LIKVPFRHRKLELSQEKTGAMQNTDIARREQLRTLHLPELSPLFAAVFTENNCNVLL
jgi:hypothetical protein